MSSPPGNSFQILREEIVSTLNNILVLIEEVLWNIVEECKVELPAYQWIGLDVMNKRSLIKIRSRIGDNTQLCGIPLLIGWGGEIDPSTITEIDLLER